MKRTSVLALALALLGIGCSTTTSPGTGSAGGSGGNSTTGGSGGSSGGSGGAAPGGTGGTGGITAGGSGGVSATGGSPGQAGSGGSTASGGTAGGDAATDSGDSAVPPTPISSEGDGVRTLMPPYRDAPESARQAGVPMGKTFMFSLAPGMIYPGANARGVMVYVPNQYKKGTPAPFIVIQDGTDLGFFKFPQTVPVVLDNLIAKGAIPAIVAVFVNSGGGDSVGSPRGLEYDTVSGLFAEYIEKEVLPRVTMEIATRIPDQEVTFTKDPEGRATMGGSSGGAGSFSMAWWRPDLFRRVLTYSGTYVNQVPANSPFPHGAWVYHDKDPYNADTPNGLIVAHCEPATDPLKGTSNPGPCDTPLTQAACEAANGCAWNTKVNKPLRVWLQSSANDISANTPASSYRNFHLANQRMAKALEMRGYHYHYDNAPAAGHVDQAVIRQTLPEALTWLWRGYKPSGN